MIEHEVGLHYLAAQVKIVFDETLVEHGVHVAPGTRDYPTTLPPNDTLKLIGSQISTSHLAPSSDGSTAPNSKTRPMFHSITSWHIPFSPQDPMEVHFTSSQGVICWGNSRQSSLASKSMHLPTSLFTTCREHSSSRISKGFVTRWVKCAYLMSKHTRTCSYICYYDPVN